MLEDVSTNTCNACGMYIEDQDAKVMKLRKVYHKDCYNATLALNGHFLQGRLR